MSQIGIFDSGVGGYTIYQACVKAYPHHSFVLLADQFHLPYGNKSKPELQTIFHSMMEVFRSLDVSTILIACNTMSSLLDDELRTMYPDLKLISIIEPTLSLIDPQKSILLLATKATLNSGKYQKAIKFMNPQVELIEVWGQDLARWIEEEESDVIEEFVKQSISIHSVSQIVLACTHYPLIKEVIAQYASAHLIDSIQVMVDQVDPNETSSLPSVVMTTAYPKRFAQKIVRLFNEDCEVIEV